MLDSSVSSQTFLLVGLVVALIAQDGFLSVHSQPMVSQIHLLIEYFPTRHTWKLGSQVFSIHMQFQVIFGLSRILTIRTLVSNS